MTDKETARPGETAQGAVSAALGGLGGAISSGARNLVDAARRVAPAPRADPVSMVGGGLGSAALAGAGLVLGEVAEGVLEASRLVAPRTPNPAQPAAGLASERTLALVKSGAKARGKVPNILARIEAEGLAVAEYRPFVPSRETAAALYAEHEGRPYFEGLLASVADPVHGVVAMVLEGRDAVRRWRALMGPTDPAKAPRGTIRGDFGTALPDNAVHGSDSAESAEREISLVFGDARRA